MYLEICFGYVDNFILDATQNFIVSENALLFILDFGCFSQILIKGQDILRTTCLSPFHLKLNSLKVVNLCEILYSYWHFVSTMFYDIYLRSSIFTEPSTKMSVINLNNMYAVNALMTNTLITNSCLLWNDIYSHMRGIFTAYTCNKVNALFIAGPGGSI